MLRLLFPIIVASLLVLPGCVNDEDGHVEKCFIMYNSTWHEYRLVGHRPGKKNLLLGISSQPGPMLDLGKKLSCLDTKSVDTQDEMK